MLIYSYCYFELQNTHTYIYTQRLTIVGEKYNLFYAHLLEHTFDNLIYQKSGQELSLSKKEQNINSY